MDGMTHYLTTDLDLYSGEELGSLAAELDRRGFAIARPLSELSNEWFCGFSLRSDEQYEEPEPQIVAMLAIIEALDPPARSVWAGCSVRMFDIGYDCGREPFFIRQELSTGTLARLTAVGATLRVTLYADPEASPTAEQGDPDGPTR